MRNRTAAAHEALRRELAADAAAFGSALSRAREVQLETLAATLHDNRSTKFGTRYKFGRIRNVDEFRERVPLSSYDDYRADLIRIRQGEPGVLTKERVTRLHLSSGTVSASKLIPFTERLARDFQKAISPWLESAYRSYEGLGEGPAYWALSPALADVVTPQSVIPVGFDSEESYFGQDAQRALGDILVGHATSMTGGDSAAFLRMTLRDLIAHPDLRWISVWSPTFLLVLWESLSNNAAWLRSDLPAARRRELDDALLNRDFTRLWPELRLVSCWADGWAARFCENVRSLFPGVPFERKGLLSTEAVVTIPWQDQEIEEPPVLAYRSHFFEFLPPESEGTLLAHELVRGEKYEVVVTTGGGLYRYRLADIVHCEGFAGEAPRLSFVGRKNLVADMCGEKLNDEHVAAVISEVTASLGITSRLCALVPHRDLRRYVLVLDSPKGAAPFDTHGVLHNLIGRLDDALSENFHYRYCRELGQLESPALLMLRYDECAELIRAKGETQRLGVLKISALERSIEIPPRWRDRLLFANASEPFEILAKPIVGGKPVGVDEPHPF